MFRKLFGETEQDQLQYLHVRSIVTIVMLALIAVVLLLSLIGVDSGAETIGEMTSMGIAIMMLFVWGWPVLKKFFGITAVGAIFSGNAVIGIVLFVIYGLASYFLGIVFAFIGTARYIYLRVKYGRNS